MLDFNLDTAQSLLYLRPRAALTAEDFGRLTRAVDPYLEAKGDLAGILIEAPGFPGWESLGAMAAHFRFVHDHHRHIKKVALVTDSTLADVVERLASHFVAAEIRHFPAGQAEAAKQWILGGS